MMPRTVGSQRRDAAYRRRPKAGKRYPLNMRTTKERRDRLEEAAVSNGRSLAQEAEERLDQSFRSEDAIGGKELALLFRMMGAVAGMVEAKTGKAWQTHYETYLAVESAWDRLWEQFKKQMRPTGSPEAWEVVSRIRKLDPLPRVPDVPIPVPWELEEQAYEEQTYAGIGGIAGSLWPRPRFSSIREARDAVAQWEKFNAEASPIEKQYRAAERATAEASEYFERFRKIGADAAEQAQSGPSGVTSRRKR